MTGVETLRPQKITLPTSATSPGEALPDEKSLSTEVDDHLDVRLSAPAVVDGQIVTHCTYVGPLDADEHGRYPTSLRGGVVTDPAEVEQIRAHIEYAALPVWRRAITRTPERQP